MLRAGSSLQLWALYPSALGRHCSFLTTGGLHACQGCVCAFRKTRIHFPVVSHSKLVSFLQQERGESGAGGRVAPDSPANPSWLARGPSTPGRTPRPAFRTLFLRARRPSVLRLGLVPGMMTGPGSLSLIVLASQLGLLQTCATNNTTG